MNKMVKSICLLIAGCIFTASIKSEHKFIGQIHNNSGKDIQIDIGGEEPLDLRFADAGFKAFYLERWRRDHTISRGGCKSLASLRTDRIDEMDRQQGVYTLFHLKIEGVAAPYGPDTEYYIGLKGEGNRFFKLMQVSPRDPLTGLYDSKVLNTTFFVEQILDPVADVCEEYRAIHGMPRGRVEERVKDLYINPDFTLEYR